MISHDGMSGSLAVTTKANSTVIPIGLSSEEFVKNRNALPKNIPRADMAVLVTWGFRFPGADTDAKNPLQPADFPPEWMIETTIRDFHFSLLDPKEKSRATIYYRPKGPSETRSFGGMEILYE